MCIIETSDAINKIDTVTVDLLVNHYNEIELTGTTTGKVSLCIRLFWCNLLNVTTSHTIDYSPSVYVRSVRK